MAHKETGFILIGIAVLILLAFAGGKLHLPQTESIWNNNQWSLSCSEDICTGYLDRRCDAYMGTMGLQLFNGMNQQMCNDYYDSKKATIETDGINIPAAIICDYGNPVFIWAHLPRACYNYYNSNSGEYEFNFNAYAPYNVRLIVSSIVLPATTTTSTTSTTSSTTTTLPPYVPDNNKWLQDIINSIINFIKGLFGG